MKPVIGIMPLYDEKRDALWMLPGYYKAIEDCGGIPMILPLTTDMENLGYFIEECDGFLLTGGQDVDPAMYGEEKSEKCGEICAVRDTMERVILDASLALDKPVFGICRGIQMLNVRLGGTLYQDLPSEHPSDAEHSMKAPFDRTVHEVNIVPGSPLHELLGVETLGVNSCHHQAIRDLADGLDAMAISEDGLVEAVYVPQRSFVMAVQWHPELCYQTSEENRKLFESFIEACM
jgi:putative glutamine amidotransferase